MTTSEDEVEIHTQHKAVVRTTLAEPIDLQVLVGYGPRAQDAVAAITRITEVLEPRWAKDSLLYSISYRGTLYNKDGAIGKRGYHNTVYDDNPLPAVIAARAVGPEALRAAYTPPSLDEALLSNREVTP